MKNELYHYGIPGMRWGHRKVQPNTAASRRYQSSKLAYKQSKKEYNKAFNKAMNYSSRRPISQFVGKKAKVESDKRWADAYDKAAKLNKDKSDYKRAKKDYKQTASANSGYSSKQRKRDRAFYGKRGEKRINKKLNQGHGLQGARHYEVERKEKREKNKKIIKKGAKKTAKIMSTIGTMYVTDQLFYGGAGTRFANQTVKKAGRTVVNTILKANGHTNINWY